MAHAAAENLEVMHEGEEDIHSLSRRLKLVRAEQGERAPEYPDLRLEEQQLAEKGETLLGHAKKAIADTFDFLVVKPAKWVGRQIKEHPLRTALIALAAFALWYYSAPLAAGLSGIKEEGVAVTSDLLGKAINIDPTQVTIFDQLIDPLNAGPAL